MFAAQSLLRRRPARWARLLSSCEVSLLQRDAAVTAAVREDALAPSAANIADAGVSPGDARVRVRFADGHESRFHSVWLLDHDPASLHPTSLQRQLDSAAADIGAPAPDRAVVEDGGARLRLSWASREVCFDADWLRQHCYDAAARAERTRAAAAQRQLWASADLPKDAAPRARAADVLRSDAALRGVLESLLRVGVAIVTDMPSSSADTERVVRRIGPPRETFYGGMWDTAPKDASQVNDTAYTKDALHGHTDTSYLIDSAGLQLFNCVAQSEATRPDGLNAEGEVEGATKLIDGYKVVADMRVRDPETYAFFARTPLKWHCIEDGVFVKAWAKVIDLQPGSSDVVRQFRYNSYDQSPVDYLAEDQVLDYYRHTRVINSYLRSPEYISYMRMNVGEMVIIDNQRVCHGRTAFSGFRNMVGCYIGRDDWLSKLRSLSAPHATTLVNDE